MLRTLLLNYAATPAFAGGAGGRAPQPPGFSLRWYPAWLARCAAGLPNSKLVDAAADDLGPAQLVLLARGFDLCVLYAAGENAAEVAALSSRLKEEHPRMRLALLCAHARAAEPADDPAELLAAIPAAEFASTDLDGGQLRQVAEGCPPAEVPGLILPADQQARLPGGPAGPACALALGPDDYPETIGLYRRDLNPARYAVSYLRQPFLSLDTTRGGRARGVEAVLAEAERARALFPRARELFLDEPRFCSDLERAGRIASGLGRLGWTWSCHCEPSVPASELAAWKSAGLRLVAANFETGSARLLPGRASERDPSAARRFTRDCRRLGVRVHGNFLLGLPGESRRTVSESVRFVGALQLDSLLVSIARGRLDHPELLSGWFRMYTRFYLAPWTLLRLSRAAWRDPEERGRRLRAGRALLRFLWHGPQALGAAV